MMLFKFGEFNDKSPCGNGLQNNEPETLAQPIAQLTLPNADNWFIKFGIITGQPGKSWIACGNQKRTVNFWSLHDRPIDKDRYSYFKFFFDITLFFIANINFTIPNYLELLRKWSSIGMEVLCFWLEKTEESRDAIEDNDDMVQSMLTKIPINSFYYSKSF